MVIETLCTVIAGLVKVILVLPTGMCLGHAVQECLCTDDVEVLTAQQNLLQAELTEALDRFDEIQSIINLYQALGGGY